MNKAKTIAVFAAMCSIFLTACAQEHSEAPSSDLENGVFAIEDAMTKQNENYPANSDMTDDLRDGSPEDTTPTPDDFPEAYNYGSSKIADYSRTAMLQKLPGPDGNETVLNAEADPANIQVLYLWEEGNVPAKTQFTQDMTGYFDSWDVRPSGTASPVRDGIQPKRAVVLMAGGAYQFRGNYTDALPTAAALRELGFQPSLWITACLPIHRRKARWMWQELSVLSERTRTFTALTRTILPSWAFRRAGLRPENF